MKFVDTNVFVRYFTGDDPAKARACLALFTRVQDGTETVTTSEAIIAEIVYVLSSSRLYGLNHQDIAARLKPLLTLRSFKLPHKRTILKALDLYANSNRLDFEDALGIAHLERLGIREIFTYDVDFSRVPGITRVEP